MLEHRTVVALGDRLASGHRECRRALRNRGWSAGIVTDCQRQVLRGEEYLGGYYGQAYAEYRRRVRRYF